MSLGAEPPRHADRRLDEAGLRAALLLEAALDAIVIPVARERFTSLRAVAADLRGKSITCHGDDDRIECGLKQQRRASLGPGDGLSEHVDPRIVAELREAIDEVLRILNRRAALRPAHPGGYDA